MFENTSLPNNTLVASIKQEVMDDDRAYGNRQVNREVVNNQENQGPSGNQPVKIEPQDTPVEPLPPVVQNQENQVPSAAPFPGYLPFQGLPFPMMNPMAPLYQMGPFGMMPGFNYPFGYPVPFVYNPYMLPGAMMPPPPLFQGFPGHQMPQEPPQLVNQVVEKPAEPQNSPAKSTMLTETQESLLKTVLKHVSSPSSQEIEQLSEQTNVDSSVIRTFFLHQSRGTPNEPETPKESSKLEELQEPSDSQKSPVKALPCPQEPEEPKEPSDSQKSPVKAFPCPEELEKPQEPDSVEDLKELLDLDNFQQDIIQEQKPNVLQGSPNLQEPVKIENPTRFSQRNPIHDEVANLPLMENKNVLTKNLSRRILAEISARRISQTTFAERICGRTQGTMSDLLKNPKPWQKIKAGKETYLKMLDWVNMCEEDKVAVIEGKPTTCCLFNPPRIRAKRPATEELGPVAKTPRAVFTKEQKELLNAAYELNIHPDQQEKEDLAKQTGLTAINVRDYFANRRRRLGRD